MARWAGAMMWCLCAIAVVGAAPASASSTRAVRVGAAPILPAHAKAVGALAGAVRLRVAVTLMPRDPAALAAYATAVATPGSAVYGHYLTVAQFAQRFGPTTIAIAAVQSALQSQGLDPGAVSPNGLAIAVRATAGELEHAFSVGLQRVALPGGRTAFANTAAPALAASAAGYVQGVVGLDTLAAPQPLALKRARAAAGPWAPTPHVVTGGPQPCSAAMSAAGTSFTADQLASAYGFSGLYGAGDQGAGQTMGIYELEGNFPNDITAFQSCYATSASVTYRQIDGGPPTPQAGTDGIESELDIENVVGLAPAAHVIVYQGPNSTSGAYDTYSAMITQAVNRPNVISTSWGICEAQGSSGASAESTLFQEAAAQGQTIVAAAGDNGSTDCGTSSLAVDDPGSQPFVTSVGGTKLTSLGPPPSETVWNGDCSSACGGGGGISTLWPMPAYQWNAPSVLNVINSSSSGSPCSAASGHYCREVPDVSGAADPSTGYVINYGGSWGRIGGTSGAAPLWAALIALANASSTCASKPIGFLNPALYGAAGSGYASAFNDVTSGNNDITGAPGNLFTAGSGYDMASGLGTPKGTALAAALCGATPTPTPTPTPPPTPPPPPTTQPVPVTLVTPGNEIGRVGAPARLQITASASGETLTYLAAGLPAGLAIDRATGVISGTPTTPQATTVTVFADDASGGSARAAFRWTVGGAPVASSRSLTGLSRRRAKLTFTVTAGPFAPAMKAVVVGLPPGLGFAASASGLARGIVVTGPGGRRLKFTARRGAGGLTITLGSMVKSVKITIAFPAIRVSAGLAAKAKHRRVKALGVAVTATDASNQTANLMLRLTV